MAVAIALPPAVQFGYPNLIPLKHKPQFKSRGFVAICCHEDECLRWIVVRLHKYLKIVKYRLQGGVCEIFHI